MSTSAAHIVRITRYETACLLAFAAGRAGGGALPDRPVRGQVHLGDRGRPPGPAGGGHDAAPGRRVGRRRRPFLAAAAGATLGVGGGDRRPRAGCRSARRPTRAHPGVGRRLADPRRPAGSWRPSWWRPDRRPPRGPGAAPPAGGSRPAPRPAVAAAAAAAGIGVPVVIGARFALEPGAGRRAVPVRPALLGAVVGVLGVVAALHLRGRGVRRRRQPGPVRPDLPAGCLPRPTTARTSGPSTRCSRAVAADPDVTGVDDARIGGAAVRAGLGGELHLRPGGGQAGAGGAHGGRMPTAPDEVVLAPHHRQRAARGHRLGGPAYRRHGRRGPCRDRHRLRAGRSAQRVRRRRLAHRGRVRPALPRCALRLQVPPRRRSPCGPAPTPRRWRAG